MKRPRFQRDELFGLSNSNVAFRNTWRLYAAIFIYFFLSLLTMTLTGDQILTPFQRVIIIGMSFIKYLPLLFVIYSAAKTKAAKYLDDIYELHDLSLAEEFIEEVTFGQGIQKITINEGKVSEQDEKSPIILIGGPGKIKVNLGSAALLEQVDGDPKIISARKEAWTLERFERIREIGEDDQAGKREYAVITLRDQFVSGLKVASRTKDGIPIEAQDIKVIFSILRNPKPMNEKMEESDPYSFDERAVEDLVYNQTMMTPPPLNVPGISFPWDTTVIPLVLYKLDQIIAKNTLSQILASISQQELDLISENEQTLKKIQVEITGEMTRVSAGIAPSLPQFESRSKITQEFYEKAFKQKAADLGVAVQWIDIGNWKLPNEMSMIIENLKGAWDLTRANATRRNEIEGSRKKVELDETLELINNTIVTNYEKNLYGYKFSDKDYDELIKLSDKSSELKIDQLLHQEHKPVSVGSKKSLGIAREMLQAFRREFLSAKEHLQKENKSEIEKQLELAKIDKAVQDIEALIFRKIK